jgi:hypothetical protein
MDGSQLEKTMLCVHVHILATMVVNDEINVKVLFLCYEHTVGSLVTFVNLSSYPLISFASAFVLPLMNG